MCRCDCGNPNNKIVLGESLKSGKTKSCGCFATEVKKNSGKKTKKHGDTYKRLWRIWSGMKSRCNYSKHIEYYNYGGRGITYCSEWNEYKVFKEWALNNGYQDNLTLERIDCNGNYSPENCKWITMKEQQNNRRNTVYLTIDGEKHSLSEWSDITGISPETLRWRLRHNWKESEMLMPSNLNNKNIRKQRSTNMGINKVILTGRICNDVEVKTSQTGTESCRINVAVDRRYVDKETGKREADFITCVAFKQQASFIGKYFQKGSPIAIEGSIRTGSYEKDGVKHYTTDVWVDNVEFCGGKNDNGGNQTNTQPAAPALTEETTTDDLPF